MKTIIQKNNLSLENSSKQEILDAISAVIKEANTFFIAGHTQPDGDALGSGLALASLLRRLGKHVTHCSIDAIPKDMMFIQGAETIIHTNKISENFDCAIILECIDFKRMGDIILPTQAKKIINIDHHLAHTNFGDINYIVPSSSSVSELVYDIFVNLKIAPNIEEAECLYVGLVTDTGRFQQLNTNSNSHLVAAGLLRCGANSSKLCKKLFSTMEISKIRLYGLSLSNIETAYDEKFVYIKLTKDMLNKAKAMDTDTDGIINYCISVPKAVVGCLLKEVDKNTTKLSFRSIEQFSLLDTVKLFGGGGHKNAAGCTINADIDTATEKIIQAFKDKL
jgi:phosphoesterase RecJ-like protein